MDKASVSMNRKDMDNGHDIVMHWTDDVTATEEEPAQ